jgi:hypothetical protein
MEQYCISPVRLHVMVLNQAQGHYLFIFTFFLFSLFNDAYVVEITHSWIFTLIVGNVSS